MDGVLDYVSFSDVDEEKPLIEGLFYDMENDVLVDAFEIFSYIFVGDVACFKK